MILLYFSFILRIVSAAQQQAYENCTSNGEDNESNLPTFEKPSPHFIVRDLNQEKLSEHEQYEDGYKNIPNVLLPEPLVLQDNLDLYVPSNNGDVPFDQKNVLSPEPLVLHDNLDLHVPSNNGDDLFDQPNDLLAENILLQDNLDENNCYETEYDLDNEKNILISEISAMEDNLDENIMSNVENGTFDHSKILLVDQPVLEQEMNESDPKNNDNNTNDIPQLISIEEVLKNDMPYLNQKYVDNTVPTSRPPSPLNEEQYIQDNKCFGGDNSITNDHNFIPSNSKPLSVEEKISSGNENLQEDTCQSENQNVLFPRPIISDISKPSDEDQSCRCQKILVSEKNTHLLQLPQPIESDRISGEEIPKGSKINQWGNQFHGIPRSVTSSGLTNNSSMNNLARSGGGAAFKQFLRSNKPSSSNNILESAQKKSNWEEINTSDPHYVLQNQHSFLYEAGTSSKTIIRDGLLKIERENSHYCNGYAPKCRPRTCFFIQNRFFNNTLKEMGTQTSSIDYFPVPTTIPNPDSDIISENPSFLNPNEEISIKSNPSTVKRSGSTNALIQTENEQCDKDNKKNKIFTPKEEQKLAGCNSRKDYYSLAVKGLENFNKEINSQINAYENLIKDIPDDIIKEKKLRGVSKITGKLISECSKKIEKFKGEIVKLEVEITTLDEVGKKGWASNPIKKS